MNRSANTHLCNELIYSVLIARTFSCLFLFLKKESPEFDLQKLINQDWEGQEINA